MNTGHLQVERAEKAQQEDKHTPGPWEAKAGATNRPALLTVYDSIGKRVAVIRTQNRPIEEADANAKLIAAAPDMLKALEGLLEATRKAYDTACNSNDDFADDDAHFVGEWIDEAKHVIAKAKGKAK